MTGLCGCLRCWMPLLSSQLSPKRLEWATQGCCSPEAKGGKWVGSSEQDAARMLAMLRQKDSVLPRSSSGCTPRSPARRVTVTPDGSSGLRIPAAPSQEEGERSRGRLSEAGYPPPSLRWGSLSILHPALMGCQNITAQSSYALELFRVSKRHLDPNNSRQKRKSMS